MSVLFSILEMPDGPKKTARLCAFVQNLFTEGEPPVLVGGGALELLTGGAYTTGDLDFVGSVPHSVRKELEALGFRKKGRHFLHEEGQVFLEFPADTLAIPGETIQLKGPDNHVLVVISPLALLVDRLQAWKFWHSEVDGQNAFLLWSAQCKAMDAPNLKRLCKSLDVLDALESLHTFFEKNPNPSETDFTDWAKQWKS